MLMITAPAVLEDVTGQTLLRQAAEQQLQESLRRNTIVFASVSGIKALLGVIEGSTVGVSLGASVSLQLGDLLQPAYEYFNFIWYLFLYALFLTSLYHLLLESNILSLGLPLGIVGTLMLLYLRQSNTNSSLLGIARSFFVTGVLAAYGIALAILIAAWVTQFFVTPLKDRAWSAAETQLAGLEDSIEKLALVRERISMFKPGESAQEIITAAKVAGNEASSVAWSTFSSLLSYVAALIVELLLLPMSLLLFFNKSLRFFSNALRPKL